MADDADEGGQDPAEKSPQDAGDVLGQGEVEALTQGLSGTEAGATGQPTSGSASSQGGQDDVELLLKPPLERADRRDGGLSQLGQQFSGAG